MLVMHSATQKAIRAYGSNPNHAVLLLGSDGIGKGSVAAVLVRAVLALPESTDITTLPAVKFVAPDEKNTVSIESIRKIQAFVRLKTTGTAAIRRAIVIEHANRMTTEAQNALLKLLEEPPADTVIILTASQLHDLLPTIRSRVQIMHVRPPAKQQLLDFFGKDYDATAITQSYFLSGGLPGLMTALLTGDKDHPLAQSVTLAKGLLQGQLFEKLAYIEGVAKQRDAAISLCEALARIAQAGLMQSAGKVDAARMKQWKTILAQASEAKGHLQANANIKLVLTHLVLQL